MAILVTTAVAAPGAILRAADIGIAEAAGGRLSIRAQTTQREFGMLQPVEVLVVFKNVDTQPLTLPITEFLGVHSLGVYRHALRETASGATWKVGVDPAASLPTAAPAVKPTRIQPGDSYVTRFSLPGEARRFWQGSNSQQPEQVSSQLAAGHYELTIEMNLPTEQVQLGPIHFSVTDRPAAPSAAAAAQPPAAVRQAADRFLAERLALYRMTNRGQPAWHRLTTVDFEYQARAREDGWEFDYVADLARQQKNISLKFMVSRNGKILDPHAGFVVITVKGQPLRPLIGN